MKLTINTLSVILILASAEPLVGQTFERTYGGSDEDCGSSVSQTVDGGYVVAGYTGSFGPSFDVYLVKTDASGDTIWTRTFGGASDDRAYSVAQTADDGYVVAGYTASFGAGFDVYLVKTDASGDTIWTRTYGGVSGDFGYGVAQTVDGGFVIVGNTQSFGVGSDDIYLVKTDASGDTMWTRTFGGTDSDRGLSVVQAADSGYVITGCTRSSGAGNYDVWLIKTDASGDTFWTRTYGGSGDDEGLSVKQAADGGYIIVGITESFGAGDYDVWLIKTDASGDTMWTRTFGSVSVDVGRSVSSTADGGYIIAGETESFGAGWTDVWLIKTDASGDTIWTRTYGGTDSDEGRSGVQTADGGYAVTGLTESLGAGDYDVWLIKTDASGLVAVAEPEPPVAHKPLGATIVRAVLFLPEAPGGLLDISGQEVLDLRAGANDVSRLSPGVYFVREAQAQAQAQAVREVVIAR